MIQATERAVFQKANMVLVSIRQAEVQYFSNFFATFGLQAAIIAGVICGILSNLHEEFECSYPWKFIYFSASAMCITSATQVLMSSLFTSVYGEQLALRGPLGSISTTIDGMIIEQHQILFNFGIMIMSFCLQQAGLSMIVMHEEWGYFCVAIVLVGMIFSYRSAQRIYNRFYVANNKTRWDDEINNVTDMVNDLDPNSGLKKKSQEESKELRGGPTERDLYLDRKKRKVEQERIDNKRFADYLHRRDADGVQGEDEEDMRLSSLIKDSHLISEAMDSNRDSFGGGMKESETSRRSSWFARLSDNFTDTLSFRGSQRTARTDSRLTLTVPLINILDLADNNLSSGTAGTILEGQLSMKSPYSLLKSDPWVRRYFIAIKGQVYYYKDIQEYSKAPTKPINRRPIDLEGYKVVADSVEPPYLITLKPATEEDNRRTWEFRCDTLSEFNFWLYSFQKAINDLQVFSGP